MFGLQKRPGDVAHVLGLFSSEIDDRFPVEEVSTGLPFLIVPLKSIESLRRARVDRDKYFALVKDAWAKGILIFCPEARRPEDHMSARVFADYYSIPEDPATGSANGCLAGYIVRHRYFGRPGCDIRVEQGYEVGRPSLLRLRAKEMDGRINISVGGKAVTVARGELV